MLWQGWQPFYVVGVICTYTYNRLMINIGQGVQKRVRDEMFEHMQTLPIRYFDQHPHGELMSRYTNDIDTLRQMINQALPMAFSSLITILAISAVMISISIPLSVLAAAMSCLCCSSAGRWQDGAANTLWPSSWQSAV